jgi:hypothetical protein
MAIDQVARVIAAVLPAAAATRDVLQALRSVGNVLAAHQAEPKRRRRRR